MRKFNILSLALCFLIVSMFMMGFAFGDAVISWGLSHKGGEQIPTVPTGSAELLDKYDGLYVDKREKAVADKKVYLTFDLGYEAGFTNAVLDILKEHDVKGVFFLCGHYLNEGELVNRMLAEGHIIGNHSDKHKDPTKLSEDAIRKEIVDFDTAFHEKFPGQNKLTFYRPPAGKFNERTLAVAKQEGLRTMMWSMAIVDWYKKPINPQPSADKITKRIHPGAIILLHIANSGMPEMLKVLIPQLMEKGYLMGDPAEL